VLLLDEPASGIDSRRVDDVLDIVAFMRDSGKTICIIEHSLYVVERLADTAIFMELGRITARGISSLGAIYCSDDVVVVQKLADDNLGAGASAYLSTRREFWCFITG
jgi:ABC-type multidrug transport system ATPase subunit